jgi:hypothetical protein
MFSIEMLEAAEGDSLWIEYGDAASPHAVLVDAGRKETYREIKRRIAARDGAPLDLFVMTHIDDDHIYGAVPLLHDATIASGTFGDVWYNGWRHLEPAPGPSDDTLGAVNGEIFAALIQQKQLPWNQAFGGRSVVVPSAGPLPSRTLPGGMKLTLLAPGWPELERLRRFWLSELEDMSLTPGDADAAFRIFEDRPGLRSDVLGTTPNVEALAAWQFESDVREPNGSSIALLAEYDGHSVLLAGDAHAPVLQAGVERLLSERRQARLAIDALKVSHHGSRKNTSSELLALLDCDCYLISTNGKRHDHPDAEAIARIVHTFREASKPTRLHFNFDTDFTSPWNDDELAGEWNYTAHYPPGSRKVRLAD